MSGNIINKTMKNDETIRVIKLKKQTFILGLAGSLIFILYAVLIRHSYIHLSFGLLILLFVVKEMMLGNRTLTLTPEGLMIGARERGTFFRWGEIENFEIKEIRGLFSKTKRIVWKTMSLSSSKSLLSRINRKLKGFDYEISQGYEVETEELFKMLNEWKGRYSQGDIPRPLDEKSKEDLRTVPQINQYTLGRGVMIGARERELFDKAMRLNWVVWGAMFLSLGAYIFFCHIMEGELKSRENSGVPLESFRIILLIISIIELALIPYMRRLILKTSFLSSRANLDANSMNPRFHPVTVKYMTALIVSLAIAESVVVYGLVIFFLGGDFGTLYLFTGLGAFGMIISRPRMDELEQMAGAMKK